MSWADGWGGHGGAWAPKGGIVGTALNLNILGSVLERLRIPEAEVCSDCGPELASALYTQGALSPARRPSSRR